MNMIYVLYVCFITGLIVGFYMSIRNEWVYKNRIRIFQTDREAYKQLPSYETMLYKWWIWDMRKFQR